MLMFRRLLPKSNIHQKNNDRQKRIVYKKVITNVSKINHFLESSRSFLARNKNRIPRSSSLVNTNISSNVLIGLNTGSINTTRKRVAARLTNNSDNIKNHTKEGLLIRFMYNYII